MSPGRLSKRARAHTDADESRIRGKRARRSVTGDSDDEDPSEAESQQSDGEEQAGDAGDDGHDDAANYYRQTQRVERELKEAEKKDNHAMDCGIIQEISCTNFMCHAQLTVPLGPLINFIIGHNGSGKSAVLTALTLCLGGKASATNRGQNLKSFIKEGTDHCTLRLKIKNEGQAAFKHDTYGDSMYVVRHFSRAGTSGFKLLDENRKLVSTKKADLEDIIDAFALQIDNPMNVLTQDMARQFLNDSTPKDKYKFFLKGTQLEDLKTDYRLIMEQLQEIENKTETLREDCDVLDKAFREALAKAQRADNLRHMSDKEELFRRQAIWARVREEEAELKRREEEIANTSQVMEERLAAADEHSAQYEQANQAYSEMNQTIQDQQAEVEPKREEVKDLQAQFKDTKNSLLSNQTQQRNSASKVKSKDSTIAKLKNQIEEHRRRQAEADGGQHAQKLAELEEMKAECERAQQSVNDHSTELQPLKDELQTARERKEAFEAKKREKQTSLSRSRDAIHELERGEGNWMDAYPNIRNILRAIDEERRFRERPVGPMGRHVKLLKPEWSSILEKSLAGTLNGFVVTSKADQNILSDLFKRNRCNFPIFIGQSRPIDTSANEPSPEHDTFMRALTIDNDLVRNQLIINNSIDQVILIPNRERATYFMQNGEPARQNIRMCLAMSDHDPTKGHIIQVNAHSGSVSLSYIDPYHGRPRMQADKEPQLRAARSNLERIKRDYDELAAESREVHARVDACQGKIQDHERRRRSLAAQLTRAQDAQVRLEAELDAATPDAGMIEQLEENLKEAEDEKTFEEGQYEDLIVQRDKLDAESRQQKTTLDAMQEEVSWLEVELGKAQAKAEKLKNKREEALRAKNAALESLENVRENKSLWEQSRDDQMTEVEGRLAEAVLICPRIEVPEGETQDSLTKKQKRVAREREAGERELGGSREDLGRLASVAKLVLEEQVAEKENVENIRKSLQKALITREQRWERFRQDISVRSRITFTYLLSERQFRGDLKIDHQRQALDLNVQPDIAVLSAAGRQTKTLSGGEKSFSTICLLLSLWDAMGSPIRCLDEFDVFMDSVNRQISMKMMIQAARRAVGRQYILITPQAMDNIQSIGDVKIIKMQDPERGQTALNMGASRA